MASDLGTTANFVNGNTYGFDDLNGITQNALSAGVTQDYDKCDLIVVGSQIKIKQGTIVFGSGATLKVPSEEYLNYTSGSINYIYGINNTTTNKIYCETSTEYPSGDFVLLGRIEADGGVKQKP